MFPADLLLLLSLLLTLTDVRAFDCPEEKCLDLPVFTPSTLVVKYGDATSATCVACKTACPGQVYNLEVPIGTKSANGTTLTWTVPNVTQWELSAMCYYTTDSYQQCCATLHATVYQPPESVSVSVVNHAGPIFEGEEYTLECTVRKVTPVQNLTVTFYRGPRLLGVVTSKTTSSQPVTEMFTLNITASRDDDGAKLRCQAELELGPGGPQPPLVTTSEEELDATVYYGPYLEGTANPQNITITEGDTLRLNCSAVGNPPPSYAWTFPSNSSVINNGSVLTITSVAVEHGGQYTCIVTSNRNTATVNFSISVQVNIIPYIIIGVAVALALAWCLVILVYVRYYKQRRMGQYNLKDVFRFHARHIAVPSEG